MSKTRTTRDKLVELLEEAIKLVKVRCVDQNSENMLEKSRREFQEAVQMKKEAAELLKEARMTSSAETDAETDAEAEAEAETSEMPETTDIVESIPDAMAQTEISEPTEIQTHGMTQTPGMTQIPGMTQTPGMTQKTGIPGPTDPGNTDPGIPGNEMTQTPGMTQMASTEALRSIPVAPLGMTPTRKLPSCPGGPKAFNEFLKANRAKIEAELGPNAKYPKVRAEIARRWKQTCKRNTKKISKTKNIQKMNSKINEDPLQYQKNEA